MTARIACIALMTTGLALTACGLPKPLPPEQLALDREFTAKFGVPGSVPLEPLEKRGVLGVALTRIFGDPQTRPKPVRLPPAMPELRVEPVPRAPRGIVTTWQPSEWDWNGRIFVWVVGRWTQPPAGWHWEGGHWTQNEVGDYAWLTGGWVA